MTTNTPGNVIGTCSATESSIKLKLELEKTFLSAKIGDEMLKTFENLASSECFKPAELALYCWALTNTFLKLAQIPNPQLVLTFGNTALNLLNNNQNDIGNIPCFGTLPFIFKFDKTRGHGPPLFVACVYQLLGNACYELKMYKESLRYLFRADKILNELEDDNDNCCLQNCIPQVLIATQRKLCVVLFDVGKIDAAVVQARNVLGFIELTMDLNSIELGKAYIETYKGYVSILKAKRALPLCLKALEFYIRRLGENSREVALLRIDLAVLYTVIGESKKAADEWKSSQTVLENRGEGSVFPKAAYIGATVLFNFSKFTEAINVLVFVVSHTGMEASGLAFAFLAMAKASWKLGKIVDAGLYMKKAETIFKENEFDAFFVGTAYLEMSDVYKMMNELGTALSLLKAVRETFSCSKFIKHQNLFAECCTKLFSLVSLPGMAKEDTLFMIDLVENLEHIVGVKHIGVGYNCAIFGISLLKSGQAGLALKVITKAKDIMDVALGPHHVDSLRTTHRLAETYAILGRYNEAAALQFKVVEDTISLEPSKQQFKDKAVRLLKNLRKVVARIRKRALSQFKDSKDCGTSRDGIHPA